MNVQSVSCQPIKPNYTKSFCGYKEDNNYDLRLLEHERDEWAEVARNKDNKLISAIGTLGVSAIAGALSFCTFKTVAPKGYKTLKTIYNAVANNKIVKQVVSFVVDKAKGLAGKVQKLYSEIKPDSTLGKIKNWVHTKLAKLKEFVGPSYTKAQNKAKEFAAKHNINKEWSKELVKNAGATAVAIPAAVTASNANDEEEGDC